MYIMRKMNREKKAATDAGRAALLADGYRDVTPPALHENTPAEAETPVKPGKVTAGKNQDPIKKSKAADIRQKKTVPAAGSSDQGMVETEKTKILETIELSESTQKAGAEGAAVPEAPHSEMAAGSAQGQPPAAS